MTDPVLSWLWLAWVLGDAPAHGGELLALYGSAGAIWHARTGEDLSPFLGEKQLERLHCDTCSPEDFAPLAARCGAIGARILPWDDPAYPAAIAALPDPPVVLYCTGDTAALNDQIFVGMVGSRRPSEYGVEAARIIGEGLAAAGAVLVSGLADGLDSAAHMAALHENARTVGILGTGIDKTYPASNRGLRGRIEACGGAVISEYPPGTGSFGSYFLQRNRLIAGLSAALCVIEARQKSGTMSTVNHARRYGVPIWAVPGSIFSPMSEGTNNLLASGAARALTGAELLLAELGLAKPQKAAAKKKAAAGPPVLGTTAAALAVLGPTPKSLEQLAAESGLPVGRLLAALTELELTGRAVALAGRQYRLA